MTLSDLKQFLDKTVTLRMTDGEIAKVKGLVVDVLETSSPTRYRDRSATYTFVASDVDSAESGE